MLKKLLREPLIHFLFIGGLLFVVYGLLNEGFDDQSKRIVFTEADISRMVLLWEKQRQRPPTQAELNGLIERQIREQVMYREALAMGLDKNDNIVRRRLAQKVEYITANIAEQVEPTEKELTTYLNAHPDKFEIPGRLDFVQIYFNVDKRGAMAKSDARHLLSKLNQAESNIDINNAGDAFMMGLQHKNITDYEISRLFGKDFAKKLFTLSVGSWNGPVSSEFGFHLIRTENKSVSSQPELVIVRDKVRTEWINEQRKKIDKAFYKSLRQRYEIIIEDVDLKDLMVSTK